LEVVPRHRRAVRRGGTHLELRSAPDLGYLYNPDRPPAAASSERGSTHGWTEIFLPGAGRITFDPTNRAVGGHNLIPVAVGRIIDQVMPMTGTFVGTSVAYQGMSVEVQVMS
jgi:transglutaminase-like putative cysteine protease